MSTEPATRQFSPAQLAAFLDELSADSPETPEPSAQAERASPEEPPTRLARPHRGQGSALRTALRPGASNAAMPEPATMLGGGHVISIGAPRWHPRGQAAAPRALRLGPQDSPRPREVEQAGSAEREIVRLTRAKPWRLAFLVVALLSAGLLGALALRPAPTRHLVVKGQRPPPLPAPPAAAPVGADPTLALTAAPVTGSKSAEAAGGAAVSLPVARASVNHAPRGTAPALAVVPTPHVTSLTARDRAPAAPGPAARREAVDTLLAGRTRAALAAYRALLVSAPSPALAHVVRLLERDLRSCTHQPEGACGT